MTAQRRHFVTGFPGFLTTYLVEHLADGTDDFFTFLVERKFKELAEDRIEVLKLTDRATVLVGDIVDGQLGLTESEYDACAKETNFVWHLAAIYDLAVEETVAYKVNVMGTVHVMEFCERCDALESFNYVSTCYVAGRREGTIFEDELDEGQSHFNHYESTKFWAEMEVQRRWNEIPTKILRPSIIVGHSTTGETDKYDGPYYLLKMLKRFPNWVPFPNVGDRNAHVNIIPIDYAVRALATIGTRGDGHTTVYHIADPNPLRPPEIVEIALESLDKTKAPASLPTKLVSLAVQNSRVERWLGTPKQVIDYFRHNATFDTTNARAILFEEDIVCPHLSNYLPTLIDYFENNPDQTFLDARSL